MLHLVLGETLGRGINMLGMGRDAIHLLLGESSSHEKHLGILTGLLMANRVAAHVKKLF